VSTKADLNESSGAGSDAGYRTVRARLASLSNKRLVDVVQPFAHGLDSEGSGEIEVGLIGGAAVPGIHGAHPGKSLLKP
jgi:hypothetical protein